MILGQSAIAATSASKDGITWNFSSDRPVGQYCNGDWWVVGPVTITSITPESVTVSATDRLGNAIQWTKNGTMVNPPPSYVSAAQGFDSSIYNFAGWSPERNKAPSFTGQPLIVPAGTSVLSSVSKSTPCTNTSNPQLEVMAVLTVVSAPPPTGSFRPSVVGNDKTHFWNKNQLNYSILRKLIPVANTPTLPEVEGYFDKHWVTVHEGNSVQVISPIQNMPKYGRDQAHLVSVGLLSLNLNYTDTQKEKLDIRMVQYGIDIYGATKIGQIWTDGGGQNNGRKAPLLLAGMALNDMGMLEWANGSKRVTNKFGYPVQPFAEDSQTWVVGQSDVGRYVDNSDPARPRVTYDQTHVGMPEWGERHATFPQLDTSTWGVGTTYRWIGGAQLGCALAFRLMPNGMSAWNHPVFFDYGDRYWSIEKINPTWSAPNGINPFVWQMYQTYRSEVAIVAPSNRPVVPIGLTVVP